MDCRSPAAPVTRHNNRSVPAGHFWGGSMQRGRATWSAVGVALVTMTAPVFGQTTTQRVSVAANTGQPIGGRYTPRPSVSGNGNTVAFESPVSSLVPGDTNSVNDIFISTASGLTRVPSIDGKGPNCASQRASVSFDGNLVAFDSCADNLVLDDTNGLSDVFLYNRVNNTVTRLSVASDGSQGVGASFVSAISPNGRFVAFLSQANFGGVATNNTHVYLRDLTTGNTFLVSQGNGNVGTSDVRPSVANNGTVAFASSTSGLVADDTDGRSDVFLRIGATGGSPSTERVNVSTEGPAGEIATRPSISADGSRVAYDRVPIQNIMGQEIIGVADVYVRDLTSNVTTLLSRTPTGNGGNGNSFEASISPNGAFVVFTSQATNIVGPFDAALDVFRAALDGVTPVERISNSQSASSGDSGSPTVADNGRVVFASDEPNLVAGDLNGDTDVFSSLNGALTRLTIKDPGVADETYSGTSLRPAPSYDGTIVAFLSSATNLVSSDTNGRTDVFVRNRTSGSTERLPIPAGSETFDADWVTISHDGRFIAYSRGAALLYEAVFLYDRFSGTTTPVSVASAGATPVVPAQPRVSASGRYVVFLTAARLDAAVDANNLVDVYRFDRITGTTALVSVSSTGTFATGPSTSPVISGDGRYVAFASAASNLVAGDPDGRTDIFVRDMNAGGITRRLSTNLDAQPTQIEARDPFISADGRYVAFLFSSTTLSAEEPTAKADVYVARTDGSDTPRLLSGTTPTAPTTEGSYDPTLSMFGRYLSFRSYAPTLVAGDTNSAADVFARRILGAGVPAPTPPASVFEVPQRLSLTQGGAQATGGSGFDTENPEISGNGTAVTYQSGLSNLVATDTNGMVDIFARTGLFDGGECTFIELTLPGYTVFATSFGLDPCANEGSPFGDPDGDGFTNDEERNGFGDGNPVLGLFTRYFAEGATKTAGINFDVRVALANPNPTPVNVELSYQLPSGMAVPKTLVTLPAYGRDTVLLDQQPGIDENGPAQSYEFATTVKADAPIAVDRLMTWDKSTYAGHAETGIVSPARTWYFAEGATIAGFNLFYLLQNPASTTATVVGRFLLLDGTVFTKEFEVPGNSRFNVWANVETFNGVAELASEEFSAVFTVTQGEPIIAERAMYRNTDRTFKAGHDSAGITAPAIDWFLAEGNAGDFFDEFVLIGNTTERTAFVEATFIVGNTGTLYTKQYQVIPNSRFNIWVDEEEINGQHPFRTGNTDVSVRIRSVNGVPLIVERAMWWPGSSNTWYEAHNSPGSTRTASRWVLAEGENGGALGWNTYILVANTGSSAGTLRIRLLLPNGQTAELTGQPVAAQSRTTYFLGDLLQTAGLPANSQAGVLIESEGTTLPLVVERAMYRNAGGVTFQVGTNALGTPLP